MKKFIYGLGFVLVLLGCGNTGANKSPGGTDVSTAGDKYILEVFSAPWCEPCEHLIPALHSRLKTEFANGLSKMDVVVVVVTGKKASQQPTLGVASEYKTALKVPFTFTPDQWKYKTYRKYYGEDAGLRIPAVVLIPPVKSKKPEKVFDPGATLDEVMAYVKTQVK